MHPSRCTRIGFPVAVVLAFACSCWYRARPEPPPAEARYLGSDSCRDCHATTYADYRLTGHYRAMRTVTAGSLTSSFGERPVEFRFGPSNESYRLVPGSPYVEEAYVQSTVRVARLAADLALGSGKYAQCYLGWRDDALFLLPLSYYSEQRAWAFGPGIHLDPESMLGFRPVSPRCIECHATYLENVPDRSREQAGPGAPLGRAAYRPSSAVLDISCEKCHGPGSTHVDYHQRHPGKPARFTIQPAALSPARQVDICALCHAPSQDILAPSFTFRPGDDLSRFVRSVDVDPARLTPHATQAPYIRHTKCFQNSPLMTCTTCHDPHRYERGNLATFSARCLNCHASRHTCPEAARIGPPARENCIDCHMPMRPASDLNILGADGRYFGLSMRTHLVAIYTNAAAGLTAPPP